MKQTYIQPSVEAIEIKVNKLMMTSLQTFDGNDVKDQPGEGIPTVNGRETDFDWDDEEY